MKNKITCESQILSSSSGKVGEYFLKFKESSKMSFAQAMSVYAIIMIITSEELGGQMSCDYEEEFELFHPEIDGVKIADFAKMSFRIDDLITYYPYEMFDIFSLRLSIHDGNYKDYSNKDIGGAIKNLIYDLTTSYNLDDLSYEFFTGILLKQEVEDLMPEDSKIKVHIGMSSYYSDIVWSIN